MAIKHIVIRTGDGHAFDPTRPGCRFKSGVGGRVEVLTTGKTDRIRVSVDGVECKGSPAIFPADHKAGKAKVVIEQIADDAVVDRKDGEAEVFAEPAAAAEVSVHKDAAPAKPAEPHGLPPAETDEPADPLNA